MSEHYPGQPFNQQPAHELQPAYEGQFAHELQPAHVEIPAAAEIDWRHLHPLSPLLRGGLALLIIFGVVVASFRDVLLSLFLPAEVVAEMGPNESDLFEFIIEENLVVWAFVVIIMVLLLIIFFSWLSWRFNTFRITTEAVEERSGIVFRQHRRAPLDRIQSVNLQRPLLARILGLTAVEVQTGGQGGKVALRYLGHADAKSIRERILIKVGEQQSPVSQSSVPQASVPQASTQQSPVPPGAVQLGPMSQPPSQWQSVGPNGEVYLVADSRLDQHLYAIADFDIDPEARATGTIVKVPFGRLAGSILLGSEMMVLIFLVIIAAVSTIWLTPFVLATVIPTGLVMLSVLISQVNKGFNFVLSRSGADVRVGAGLTSTVTETIPFERIHAVEASQPIGWRLFGWWKVRITTAGHALSQGGQNRLQNTVLPVGRVDDVLRVLDTVLPGAASAERAAELYDGLVGRGEGYVGGGRNAGWVLWFGRRRAGIKLAGGEHPTLRIRRGAVTRSLRIMPIVRAQSLQLRRQGAHRLLGLAALFAHTVLGPVQMQMRGLDLRQAQQLFDELATAIVSAQQQDHGGGVAHQQHTPSLPPTPPPPATPSTPPAPTTPNSEPRQ